MSSKSGRPDINRQRIREIPLDLLTDSSRNEAVNRPKLKAASIFKLERFHNSFNTSLHQPDCHSAEASEELLFKFKTIENEGQNQTFIKKNFSGWRGGIALNATMACSVLLINAVILIWVTAKFDLSNGLATIFSGDCNTAKHLSVAAHLIINILSTLLLGASNYAMQVASSPSRANVNKAHGKGKWLDIGVLSFRNLKWISKYQLMAYGLLLLSSIPLHFIYNSVLSSSLAALFNGPVVLYVTPEYFTDPASAHIPPTYIQGESWDYWTQAGPGWSGEFPEFPALAAEVRRNATLGQLKQVGVIECNNTLASYFQNNYASIVFVQTSMTSENNSLIEMGYYGINSQEEGGPQNPSNYYNLTDCWVGAMERLDCQLLLNSNLMLGVVISNAIKGCVMILMVLKFTKPSLVTLGDAIASFLGTEDCTTTGLRTIKKQGTHQAKWFMQETMAYENTRKRWGSSPSPLRWGFSILICISFVAIAARYFNMALDHVAESSIWSLGFGKPNTGSGSTNIGVGSLVLHPVTLILLANTPQMVLSTGYVLVNNLLTTMLGAREWSKIGHTKTRLRTTVPQGQQRSTYFLQLPYKYSLPLMLILGTLHYLVSMSLFVVNISHYDFDTNGDLRPVVDNDADVWKLEYSPLAILCALIVSLLLLSLPIALAFRKLYPGIPMANSHSALISAACHPPPEESDASLLPVQWGVVEGSIDPDTGIGRCTISSREVSKPIEGRLYL